MGCGISKSLGLAPDGKPKGLRVWVDGCFDSTTYGHSDLCRQAAEFGLEVVVGIHSDEEIRKHKGNPVSTEAERYRLMAACKWVTEIVKDAPYVTTQATLIKYNCQFAIHGNDMTYTDAGADTYAEVKSLGLYRETERSLGVSTSNLIARILHIANQDADSQEEANMPVASYIGAWSMLSKFANHRKPKSTDKVILVVGVFDMFHEGHINFLERAKEKGDYLLIALFADESAKQIKGRAPILTLVERAMSVLAYRPADDVILGLPNQISVELLERYNIHIVVNGTPRKRSSPVNTPTNDPFAEAKKRDIYVEVDSGSNTTTSAIIARVVEKREMYEKRNREKEQKEKALGKSSKLV